MLTRKMLPDASFSNLRTILPRDQSDYTELVIKILSSFVIQNIY